MGSVGLPDQGSHAIGSNALIGTGSHGYFTCFMQDKVFTLQSQAKSSPLLQEANLKLKDNWLSCQLPATNRWLCIQPADC